MLKSLTVCLGGMSMREIARMVRVCGTALSELRRAGLPSLNHWHSVADALAPVQRTGSVSVDSHTILRPHIARKPELAWSSL